mmetsp:Transcript_36600/g.82740  ORF Transcript_36600/g.82740 Transcript_36600/m.82740 type:complete len:918 (-) Transcript_36600:96-2849(-)
MSRSHSFTSLGGMFLEQQKQMKQLSALCVQLCQAHVALREHHVDLFGKVSGLCDCLHQAGHFTEEKLASSTRVRIQLLRFYEVLDDTALLRILLLSIGTDASRLGNASRYCTACIAKACATTHEQPAATASTVAGVPLLVTGLRPLVPTHYASTASKDAPCRHEPQAECSWSDTTVQAELLPAASKRRPLRSRATPPFLDRGAKSLRIILQRGVVRSLLITDIRQLWRVGRSTRDDKVLRGLVDQARGVKGKAKLSIWPWMWRLEREARSVFDTCCHLVVQDMQDNLVLARAFSSVLDSATISRFRAVSRASDYGLRGALSKHKLRRRSSPIRDRGPEPVHTWPDFVEEASSGSFTILLEDAWQQPLLSYALTSGMTTSMVRSLSATSHAGHRCMRGALARSVLLRRGRVRAMTQQLYEFKNQWDDVALCNAIWRLIKNMDQGEPPVLEDTPVALEKTSDSASEEDHSQAFMEPGRLHPDPTEHHGALQGGKYSEGTYTPAIPADSVVHTIRRNDLVRLQGLKSMQDLNGSTGRVVSAFPDSDGRLQVVMSTGMLLRVRPSNVRSIAPDRAATRYLYVCGGFNGRYSLSSVDCFDVDAQMYIPVPHMLRNRYHGLAFGIGKDLYVLGGYDRNSAIDGMERYNAVSMSWQVMPPMPKPGSCASGVVLDGDIYIFGGCLSGDVPLQSAEVYRVEKRVWQELPSMQHARSLGVAVATEHRILVCGGYDKEPMEQLEQYDVAGNWQKLMSMREGRLFSASVCCSRYLYMCGGSTSGTHMSGVNTAERFDLQTNLWEVLPPMNSPRAGGAAAVGPRGMIVICGGTKDIKHTVSDDWGSLRCTESYDPNLRCWFTLSPMLQPRSFAATIVVPGKLYVFGGNNGKSVVSSVERLDLDTGTWEPMPVMREARVDAACAATSPQVM